MSDSILLANAVRPSGRDLAETRSLVLDALSASPSMSMSELETLVYSARVVPAASPDDRVRVEGSTRVNATKLDEHSPIIIRKRLCFALREVLGALIADGAIVNAAGDDHGSAEDTVPAIGDNWSGVISFRHDYTPAPQGRVKLNSSPTHRLELIDASLVTEMRYLLGPRGIDVLAEGIRCYHRGFFIAAVDLLGAASEAAWFGLAAVIRDDLKLAQYVASGTNAAEVIDRTFEAVRRSKTCDRHVLTDLRAQAARFRDLRNYGVHPVGTRDDDREPAFTESGCAVLYMSAPRYLRQLDGIRQALSRNLLEPVTTSE